MKVDNIIYFEVDEYGTISYADFCEVKTRDDAYNLSLDYDVSTPVRLVSATEDCYPLQWLIAGQYAEYRENPIYPARLKSMPGEPESGWIDWVLGMDDQTFSSLRAHIKKWLSEEPDWTWEGDYIHYTKWSDGAAFAFFEGEPEEVRDALGVALIDGPYPGNDYRGAELLRPVDEANVVAEIKGLDYRFRKEKKE
jgi:hypothetical protein